MTAPASSVLSLLDAQLAAELARLELLKYDQLAAEVRESGRPLSDLLADAHMAARVAHALAERAVAIASEKKP